MKHVIGREYRYPGRRKRFKLILVDGWMYYFYCGHWCTDSVFEDLFDCVTKKQNYLLKENLQLKLEI